MITFYPRKTDKGERMRTTGVLPLISRFFSSEIPNLNSEILKF